MTVPVQQPQPQSHTTTPTPTPALQDDNIQNIRRQNDIWGKDRQMNRGLTRGSLANGWGPPNTLALLATVLNKYLKLWKINN